LKVGKEIYSIEYPVACSGVRRRLFDFKKQFYRLAMPAINSYVIIPLAAIRDFSRRWKITEFSLFGSVLREDFGPEIDVYVLVSFEESAGWSLLDLVKMEAELQEIFGREVDLVEKDSLPNPFRRHAIMSGREVVYATG
jgi:predicted nucleotidyltransferase